MKYGYARVSTAGQSCEDQIEAILKHGVAAENIVMEIVSTRKAQPMRDDLLKKLKKSDSLAVWSMDRLGRSMIDVMVNVTNLLERGISVYMISQNFPREAFMVGEDGKPTIYTTMLLSLLAAFGETEREMIASRIKRGKRASRDRSGMLVAAPHATWCKNTNLTEHIMITAIIKRAVSGVGVMDTIKEELGDEAMEALNKKKAYKVFTRQLKIINRNPYMRKQIRKLAAPENCYHLLTDDLEICRKFGG